MFQLKNILKLNVSPLKQSERFIAILKRTPISSGISLKNKISFDLANNINNTMFKDKLPFRSGCNIQCANMSDCDDKKSDLKSRLTPLQFHVTQEKGTERPFTGKYNKCYETGTYSCVVCDQELFSSETKFDSGCGWPAFNDVVDQGKVKLTKDTSHGMVRTEVTCSECGAHLGHVFGDGPAPTRRRFCINSASLLFHPAGEEKKEKDSS